jgi:hypothetical protein
MAATDRPQSTAAARAPAGHDHGKWKWSSGRHGTTSSILRSRSKACDAEACVRDGWMQVMQQDVDADADVALLPRALLQCSNVCPLP